MNFWWIRIFNYHADKPKFNENSMPDYTQTVSVGWSMHAPDWWFPHGWMIVACSSTGAVCKHKCAITNKDVPGLPNSLQESMTFHMFFTARLAPKPPECLQKGKQRMEAYQTSCCNSHDWFWKQAIGPDDVLWMAGLTFMHFSTYKTSLQLIRRFGGGAGALVLTVIPHWSWIDLTLVSRWSHIDHIRLTLVSQ